MKYMKPQSQPPRTKKPTCTCAATNLQSSRGAEQPLGLCTFNRGAATGPRKDLMVHCNRCGAWTCRSCIRSLRVAARAEALRCKHLRVLQYDALLWLMAERASAKDLFDTEQSGGVLVADEGGCFTSHAKAAVCSAARPCSQFARGPSRESLLRFPIRSSSHAKANVTYSS